MTDADLTPGEREQIQEYYLRRWLAVRCPPPGRRATDQPLPRQALSPAQLDRYCRWAAARRKA